MGRFSSKEKRTSQRILGNLQAGSASRRRHLRGLHILHDQDHGCCHLCTQSLTHFFPLPQGGDLEVKAFWVSGETPLPGGKYPHPS